MTDAFAQLTAHQIALRIRARPAIGNLIKYIVLLPSRIRRNRGVFLAYLPLAQVIEAKIGHDAINPRIKRELKAKLTDALVPLQKTFLINILGFVFRAGKMQRQPQHRLIVASHQLLEGSAIATLRLADQYSVVDT